MDVKLSLQSIVAAVPDHVSCPLGDESAILNLTNTVYYGLNGVGTSVWKLLREPRTVRQLRDALLEEYDVEPARCELDLLALLEKMQGEGLIQLQRAVTS
jgi:hypothetical protein